MLTSLSAPFSFITLLVWGFSLTDREIILIAVLNDLATLVISVDNTQISRRPDKWRVGQLLTLSLILALLLAGFSFATFFIARDGFKVTWQELQTILYLQISSCPHFVIFSSRVPGYFWENRPSWIFVTAVMATQVFAMFISIFGLPGVVDVGVGCGFRSVIESVTCDLTLLFSPISTGGWGFAIIGTSLLCMVFLDWVKVMVIRYWSFELTAALVPTPARRRKLRERKETAARRARVEETKAKVRKVITAISFVDLVARGMPKSWEEGARRLSIAMSDVADRISRRGSVAGTSRRGSMMSRKASGAISVADGRKPTEGFGRTPTTELGRRPTTEMVAMREAPRRPSAIVFADEHGRRPTGNLATGSNDHLSVAVPAPSAATLPPVGPTYTSIPLFSVPGAQAQSGSHEREESDSTVHPDEDPHQ